MSTKSTIYYQAEDKERDEGYFHLYYDISGVYRDSGIYLDWGSGVVRIKDPAKLIAELNRTWQHLSKEYETSS